jgi:hypothetical protein
MTKDKDPEHTFMLPSARRSDSLRIVENDTQCMTVSRPNAAHAVPEIYSIHAVLALYRTIMNCKHNAVPLSQRHNRRSPLHSRPLFCHHEFAASPCASRSFETFSQSIDVTRSAMLLVLAGGDILVVIGLIFVPPGMLSALC